MSSYEEKWKEVKAKSTQWLISQLHERQSLEMLFKEIGLPKSDKKQDDKRFSKLRFKRFRIFSCGIL